MGAGEIWAIFSESNGALYPLGGRPKWLRYVEKKKKKKKTIPL